MSSVYIYLSICLGILTSALQIFCARYSLCCRGLFWPQLTRCRSTSLSSHDYQKGLLSVEPDSFAAPWTVVRQTSLSIGFPRQEYWGRLPFPSPGDLPVPTQGSSLQLQVNTFISEPSGKPKKVSRHSQMSSEQQITALGKLNIQNYPFINR